MSMIPRRWLFLAATMLCCNSAPEQPDRDPPPRPPLLPRSSAQATSASATAAAAPPSTGEVAAAAEPGDLAGAWEGRYDAKKGTVTLPPKVKDKALAADEGKTSVGPGSIEIAITAKGDIRGKMTGALGAAAISGKVDGAMIRAVVRPDDPFVGNAMTGIFVGEHKGDVIACELHVAGADGTVIRESTVELKRKK